MKRRKFINKASKVLISSGLATAFYTWQVEPFWLDIVKLKLPISNLPASLNGKSIVQISDIHIGNSFDSRFIIESFREAQKLNPDFVFYTGDFITYENHEQIDHLAKVMQSCVKGKIGTAAILGNHDYGHKWSEEAVAQQVINVLSHQGITVLRNSVIDMHGLNIIGIDDYWAINFNPQKALEHYDPKMANIVLCHNPDVCDLDIWNEYKGWILCGHTHGGQCRPPFLDPPLLPVKNRRYTSGTFDLNDGRFLYINRALGHSRQVRFMVRPEITYFEMVV